MPTDSPSTTHNRKRNYLLWISLTSVVLCSVVGGLAALLVHKSYSLTSTQQATLPVVQPPAEKTVEIKQRIESFSVESASQPSTELVLSANDLNTLVANSPEFAGKAYVQIEGNQVQLQTAVPLDTVPGFAGRYLNGTVALDVALENGQLTITPTNFYVQEQHIPQNLKDAVLKALQAQNINQRINTDPRVQAWLNNITDIQVENGNLIIKK